MAVSIQASWESSSSGTLNTSKLTLACSAYLLLHFRHSCIRRVRFDVSKHPKEGHINNPTKPQLGLFHLEIIHYRAKWRLLLQLAAPVISWITWQIQSREAWWVLKSLWLSERRLHCRKRFRVTDNRDKRRDCPLTWHWYSFVSKASPLFELLFARL